jgi:hypothetical protein
LPNTRNTGHAYDIAVDGADVYAVGSVYDFTDSTEIATYWKNNVPYSCIGKYIVPIMHFNVTMMYKLNPY